MKDIHSHILYGIDDGSKTIDESVELIRCASQQGVTDLMLTPHYMEDTEYTCNNEEKMMRFKYLKEKVKENGIDINLYLGNEVFYTKNFLELLQNDEIRTLNNSKYILFEFPLNNQLKYTREIIFELINKGYIPILAHPERYAMFKKNPDSVMKYLELGVLLQGNYQSLYGGYGFAAKKLFKYYLKKGWYTFLGSDTHHNKKFKVKKLEKHITKLTKNSDYAKDLMYNNFDIVIENKDFSLRRF